MHPRYLGWQMDWPVFVKTPFSSFGKPWKKNELFDWQNFNSSDPEKVAQLYASGFIAHNEELQKETKAGDRLGEMNSEHLRRLVVMLNDELKKNTQNSVEFNKKKCKHSRIDDKQRGLIRTFLIRQPWITDKFYEFRDTILGD